MDSINYFDKLDALAIMALHYSENNKLELSIEQSELTWRDLFVFITTKCLFRERIFGEAETRLKLGLEYVYDEPDMLKYVYLDQFTCIGHFQLPIQFQVKRILFQFKLLSERLKPHEFIIQHHNDLKSMLLWLARYMTAIRFRTPMPFEIPVKCRMAFGICIDHKKLVEMYRYGLIDNPVHIEGYRYIVNYLKWRTNLPEERIHQYLANEEYTMFDGEEDKK